ncbi:MAG TPA: radical SAM family heme chaperone HemW [Acidobacteriaceae bacterium]|nr:radical SAM family heme chaperone HemW [Acidobacteriaceae bacterium]
MPDTLGIYVSIPFCRAKCSYCNFASGVFGSERMSVYVDRLTSEIRECQQRAGRGKLALPRNVDSIYFGGGTPSLLSSKQMQQIMGTLQEVFHVGPRAEVTLECAPGQLEDDLLQALPNLGFNRVSLGVQSFIDREAAAVGRLHTRASTLLEIARLRSAGIHDINVDLIAGLPRQREASWRESLDVAISTGVPHLSVYMLDVDADSRLGREMLAGGTRYGVGLVPREEQIAAMYNEACERFAREGMAQYEISNFARVGHQSRHNLKYWTRQPYLGFGLDAHSFLFVPDGTAVRFGNTDNLDRYINGPAEELLTAISATEAMEEAWFLGLRLARGVSLAELEKKIGAAAMRAYRPILAECEQQKLVERSGMHVRLTSQGRLFANDVLERFLGVIREEDSKIEFMEQGALV